MTLKQLNLVKDLFFLQDLCSQKALSFIGALFTIKALLYFLSIGFFFIIAGLSWLFDIFSGIYHLMILDIRIFDNIWIWKFIRIFDIILILDTIRILDIASIRILDITIIYIRILDIVRIYKDKLHVFQIIYEEWPLWLADKMAFLKYLTLSLIIVICLIV